MKNVFDFEKIIITSHIPEIGKEAQKCFLPLKSEIFNGEGYPSFSKLINDCIISCPTELVIISNQKSRATAEDIHRIIKYLKMGYGIVGLAYFGLCGFTKELIRRVGFWDERYIGGQYEDVDFYRRLKENNIASILCRDIPYYHKKCSWNNDFTKKFDKMKWSIDKNSNYIRKLEDEKYDYDLGNSVDIDFLPYSETIFLSGDKPAPKDKIKGTLTEKTNGIGTLKEFLNEKY